MRDLRRPTLLLNALLYNAQFDGPAVWVCQQGYPLAMELKPLLGQMGLPAPARAFCEVLCDNFIQGPPLIDYSVKWQPDQMNLDVLPGQVEVWDWLAVSVYFKATPELSGNLPDWYVAPEEDFDPFMQPMVPPHAWQEGDPWLCNWSCDQIEWWLQEYPAMTPYQTFHQIQDPRLPPWPVFEAAARISPEWRDEPLA